MKISMRLHDTLVSRCTEQSALSVCGQAYDQLKLHGLHTCAVAIRASVSDTVELSAAAIYAVIRTVSIYHLRCCAA
jgi:hypothetical protein